MHSRCKRNLKQYFEVLTKVTEIVKEMNVYVEAVIVEGVHDERTLRALGFKRPIIKYAALKVNEAELITKIADRYAGRVITVLTDFDAYGEAICKRLTRELQNLGVKVDLSCRKELECLLKPISMTTVESIYSLKKRCYT